VETFWEDTLENLRPRLKEQSFNEWFSSTTVLKVEKQDDLVYVCVNDKYAKSAIETLFMDALTDSLCEALREDVTPVIVDTSAEPLHQAIRRTETTAALTHPRPVFNPRYTFDSFVVGANNQFAHAASLSVAENPGKEYNPLFIYGGPGLGKTHLMHSIAHFILDKNKKARIQYVTSEIFTNELIGAIQNRSRMESFKEKYRNVDVLLIDDVQFIVGKDSTETEFFHTFNDLRECGKQIVLSSDRPPKDFVNLEERLRSRFESGLSVDITAPDYETRMAILRKKEEMEGYTVDNEILQYIATNIKTNIRELEGALTKMSAYSKLHPGTPLTLDVARENLKDMINPEQEKKTRPDHIIQVVAEHYGLRPEDIKSQKRNREIVLPRQICMYLIRVMNDISLSEVGEALGKRDHSTIIHGYEKIIKEMSENKDLDREIEILKKKLLE